LGWLVQSLMKQNKKAASVSEGRFAFSSI